MTSDTPPQAAPPIKAPLGQHAPLLTRMRTALRGNGLSWFRFLLKRWKELLLPLLLALVPITDSLMSNPNGDPEDVRWGVMERFARLNFDLYLSHNRRVPDPAWPVKIIDIDETSLKAIGQWPWPRSKLAELVDALTGYDVRVIVFDMVFAEPDRLSPNRLLAQLESQHASDAATRAQLDGLVAGLPDNDALLAAAIKRSGRVVTGVSVTSQFPSPPARIPRRGGVRLLNLVAEPGKSRTSDPGLINRIGRASGMIANRPAIEKAAVGNAVFNMNAGFDGLVRRIPMIYGYAEKLDQRGDAVMDHRVEYFPTLVLEALRVGSGKRRTDIRAELEPSISPFLRADVRLIRVGEHAIPVRPNGSLPIYFAGHLAPVDDPANAIQQAHRYIDGRYISASKVLDQSVDPAALKDRYVFIGTSAAGLLDLRSSPLDKLIPGVEFHVEALEQILQNQFLLRDPAIRGLEILAAAALALLAVIVLQLTGPAIASIAVLTTAIALYVLSYERFVDTHQMIDPVLPITTLLLTFITTAGFNLWRTHSEKAELRGTFGLYLSPDLVNELADDPSRLTLGGEIREMSILFSDIRGFTSISEQYDPQSLTKLINAFLTPMTGYVLERRGTIDKYMGDALMAFWNAPLDDPKHAENACLAALEMTAVLGPLNERLEQEAKAAGRKFLPLNAGVGINTGLCCVGNVGSEQRFAYSVLGDAVNLASRLEGQTKAYGMAMIVGETTQAQVPHFATIELDMIRVKGKLQPVTIYGLFGDDTYARDPDFLRLKQATDAMLAAYRQQQWDETERQLAAMEAATATLADRLPRGCHMEVLFTLYRQRIADYRANPPGDDWDGVYTATSK